ncbi:uncharacterized protein Z518_04877 [Rhinocladiella mackenziei CBS 650.93]|uniref:Uncharacterized protein n=1 Tax=Rhinocladiella mackenziei CBS 650.93 TaxID=1442369 RepID=A0A0D2IUR0_9EURO|nr:uncharacterized protein Z518_04877 [Rhinocladiella mackenziei CBS 650.93]KIX06901.1 hypothetical protein Z518_04877 [Rhinocladiella mackenziei CBS 650.93]
MADLNLVGSFVATVDQFWVASHVAMALDLLLLLEIFGLTENTVFSCPTLSLSNKAGQTSMPVAKAFRV